MQYVRIAFPLQERLHARTPLLSYTYSAYLVIFYIYRYYSEPRNECEGSQENE
jgi:hypothetical protein